MSKEYYCEELDLWVAQEDVSIEVNRDNKPTYVHFLLEKDIVQVYHGTEVR